MDSPAFLLLALTVSSAAMANDAKSTLPHADTINWPQEKASDQFSLVEKSKASLKPCDKDPENLYPTHPQEMLKTYYSLQEGKYTKTSVFSGDDDACKVGQNKKQVSDHPQKLLCFLPGTPVYLKMSDFYMDRCGNYYRGVWERAYIRKNPEDDDGHQNSLGRYTAEISRNSVFQDSQVQNTNPVPVKDFLFFTPVTADERNTINSYKASALKNGFKFDESSYLFLCNDQTKPCSKPSNVSQKPDWEDDLYKSGDEKKHDGTTTPAN